MKSRLSGKANEQVPGSIFCGMADVPSFLHVEHPYTGRMRREANTLIQVPGLQYSISLLICFFLNELSGG